MAEEVEGTEELEEALKKGQKKMLIVIVAMVLVAALGAAAFFLFGGKSDEDQDASNEAKKIAAAKKNEPGPLVNMDSFVVNVSSGEETCYLKTALTVELVDEPAKESFLKWEMLMRNEVMMYLSSIDTKTTRSVKAKRGIENRLKRMLNKRLKNNLIVGVYFTEFVTQ